MREIKASECFHVVRQRNSVLDEFHIVISHPPEAIEEVEVPVWMPFDASNKFQSIGGYTQTFEGLFIKLHRCKLCGMIILDGDCEVVK